MTRERTCVGCGAVFLASKPSQVRKFCGHPCKGRFYGNAAMITPEASAKSGDVRRGRGKGDGYVKRGGRHEHRVVMERVIGRPLRSDEIVHHRDEVKPNNAEGNLELTTRADHFRHHVLSKPRRRATHCRKGHEFTAENTRLDAGGRRCCVICYRAYHAKYQRLRRARMRASK